MTTNINDRFQAWISDPDTPRDPTLRDAFARGSRSAWNGSRASLGSETTPGPRLPGQGNRPPGRALIAEKYQPMHLRRTASLVPQKTSCLRYPTKPYRRTLHWTVDPNMPGLHWTLVTFTLSGTWKLTAPVTVSPCATWITPSAKLV